jgi:HlyD family secretion protein
VSRGRTLALVLAGAIGAVLIILALRRNASPAIPFTKVTREAITSTLTTNGKVEPIEWASARAERPGVIKKVMVHRGQNVASGTALIELDTRDANAQLANAEAQIAQAQAQQQALLQGGSGVERAQIENDLQRARLDLESARHNAEAVDRLVSKQAAPETELTSARQHVEQLQIQVQGLEERRKALVSSTDKDIAEARLQQAFASANLARSNLALSSVRAPIGGTVYQFDLRIGAFVNAGDLVADIGKLSRVRVAVYVDEPELGRVRINSPVTITWDAVPQRQWKGVVDRLPTQIIALGTRQVGEVGCIIDNPDNDLLPGTNINAEIVSSAVKLGLTITRSALRREGTQNGVLVLVGDHLEWRPVELGISSYAKVQVVSGLNEGDSVALTSDKPIKSGTKVQPVYP